MLRRLAPPGGLEPALPEQKVVLVGGRDLDPGERDNVDRSQLRESDDAAGALAAFPGETPLYVHARQGPDALDPSLTPDAGFPAPGGVERMRSELATLAASGRVVALSVDPARLRRSTPRAS